MTLSTLLPSCNNNNKKFNLKSHTTIILVIFSVVAVTMMFYPTALGEGDDHHDKFEEAKDNGAHHAVIINEKDLAFSATDDSEQSWTEWAKDKLSGGLGLKDDHDDDSIAHEAATKIKDKITDAATGSFKRSAEYTADKAADMKDATTEKAKSAGSVKDKAYEAAEVAKQKSEQAYDDAKEVVVDKAEEAKHGAAETEERLAEEAKKRRGETEDNLRWVKGKAKEGYETAGETLESAIDAAKGKSQQMKMKDSSSARIHDDEL